jgi:hypothetical protein
MFRGLFTKEEKVLEGVEGNGKSAYSDDVWAPADMLYEPPLLEVTQPKGSFCTIHTRFAAALDPDGVYDIVTDPNNHRVFRNIKEVVYRKVLEDDGNRQYVEVEQLGRWKFLIFSGSFATRIFLEQKRREKTLSFDLAKKGGMMRKFSGSWTIEPMRASETVIPAGTEAVKTEDESDPDPIVGSWVTFQQVVEPTVKPPWPLSDYIRGITEKIIREMLADLQRECQRLSELRKSTTPAPTPAPETDSTPKVESETTPAPETDSTPKLEVETK